MRLSNEPLFIMYTSIQNKRQSLNPNIFGGIISGIGGLFGQNSANKANIRMTRETNQANKEIAESNNRWQQQMMNEQNQWNLEQWNRENRYNSASSQVSRYLEAGINPALAMTNGASAGQAGSLQSASAGQANNATMQAPQQQFDASLYNTLGTNLTSLAMQASQMAFDKPKRDADILGIRALADLNKAYKLSDDLRRRGIRWDNRAKRWQAQILSHEAGMAALKLRVAEATEEQQVEAVRLQNDYLRARRDLTNFQASAQVINNKYLDDHLQAQIAESNARTAKMEFERKRGEAMQPWEIKELRSRIDLQTEQALKTAREKGLIPEISKDDLEVLKKAYVDNALYGAMEQQYNSYTAQYNSHIAGYNANVMRYRSEDWDRWSGYNLFGEWLGNLWHGSSNYSSSDSRSVNHNYSISHSHIKTH